MAASAYNSSLAREERAKNGLGSRSKQSTKNYFKKRPDRSKLTCRMFSIDPMTAVSTTSSDKNDEMRIQSVCIQTLIVVLLLFLAS